MNRGPAGNTLSSGNVGFNQTRWDSMRTMEKHSIFMSNLTWASYQTRKIASCGCTGNVGNVIPVTDFKGNRGLTHWGRVTHICVSELGGAKPLSEKKCWIIVHWTLRNKLQWNLNRNSNIFIQENALEHVVCEMASILSRPQCVKLFRCALQHVRNRYLVDGHMAS